MNCTPRQREARHAPKDSTAHDGHLSSEMMISTPAAASLGNPRPYPADARSPQLTYAEVVEAIFGSIDPKSIHVTEFKGDPHNKDEARWNGQRLSGRMLRDGRTQAPSGDANSFICLGVLDPDIPGRGLAQVIGHVAFWMDDVGDAPHSKTPFQKVNDWIAKTGLQPTLVVETSPGNFSYLWSINRVDADGGFEDQTVAAIRAKLKAEGLGDPVVATDAARYMRSGFGINGKKAYRQADGSPWQVRIAEFNPGNRVHVNTVAAAMLGAGWRDEIASGKYLTSAQIVQGGPSERNASMDDPLVKLAALAGLDPQPSTRAGVIDAHCPNEHNHTGGDPTGYAFINKGMSFCNHASCGHLNSPDFQSMIEDRYDQMIADGLANGTIIDNMFGPGLLDVGTREVLAPTARTFLAAETFKDAGVDAGGAGGIESVKKEAEQVAATAHKKDLDAEAKRAALFERFVYVGAAETFWDRDRGELISSSRLDKDAAVIEVHGYHSSGDKRASVKMLNDIKNLIRVDTTTIQPFRPDQPPSSDIVLINGKKGSITAINEFVPTQVGIKQGNIVPWLDHLHWMYGDQPEVLAYLLDMMAFFVQHPNTKSSVIPVLVGRSGIGKDLAITDPLIDLLGRHNHANVTAYQLANDNFNEFLKKPLIHMGEFSMAGRDSAKIYDRLKSFSSTATLTATINPKYGKQYDIDVLPKFIGTTNNDNSLESMTDEDRRFFIARSNAEAKKGLGYGNGPGTDPYFKVLTGWLKTPGSLEAIHYYLLNRQISVFDPNTAPPRTASRHDVVVASLNAVAQFAYDLVTEGDLAGRKVFSFAEVHERAIASADPSVRTRATPKQLAEGLRAAGCRDVGRVRVGGRNRARLWTGACVVLNGTLIEGSISEAERDRLRADPNVALSTYTTEVAAATEALAKMV